MPARITTSFTATSTASEVVAGIDLSGRRAVVTGASSGIGTETARALAGAPRVVVIVKAGIRQRRKRSQDKPRSRPALCVRSTR
jgi:predicted amino acid dehydrogenase